LALVHWIASVFQQGVTDSDAREHWDAFTGVIAAFATLVCLVLLWEPRSKEVAVKIAASALLAFLALAVSFRKRIVASAALVVAGLRFVVGAIEIRSLAGVGLALACFAGAIIIYLTRPSDQSV
jgi:hypothetical protein